LEGEVRKVAFVLSMILGLGMSAWLIEAADISAALSVLR
jgi:hypothetical protein